MRKWIARRANDLFAWIRLLPWRVKRPLRWFWRSIPSHLAFYLLLIVVVYAIWNGWQRDTVISPFHLPPENKEKPMPFSGETVASTLQDAFTAIRMEAGGERPPAPCEEVAPRRREFGGLAAHSSGAFQVSRPVGVEVKGVSVEALVSEAREVLGRERNISGDVLLDDADQFRVVARANDAGPWTVGPYPLKLEGLRSASCKLAEQILQSTDKNLLGAALIRREDYARVLELYKVTPKGNSDRADALNNLGVALRETGKSDESIASFQEALNLKAKFPEAHYNLGVAFSDKGEHALAMVEDRKALALKPDFSDARYNLGSDLSEMGQIEESIKEYRKVLAFSPDAFDAYFSLGDDLARTGQYDEAIVEYRKGLVLNPDDANGHGNLGAALADKMKYDEAIPEYRKALALKPDIPYVHHNLGAALSQKGQYDEAIIEFRKNLKLQPNNALSHFGIGIALGLKGQHDEAVVECGQALSLDPSLVNYGMCPRE